jgi:hypothetical protein
MSLLNKVLHKAKTRAPPELVAKTLHAVEKLTDGGGEKNLEVAKYLAEMKAVMFGAGDSEVNRYATKYA